MLKADLMDFSSGGKFDVVSMPNFMGAIEK